MTEDHGSETSSETPLQTSKDKPEAHQTPESHGHHSGGVLTKLGVPHPAQWMVRLGLAIVASLVIGKVMELAADDLTHNRAAVTAALAEAQAEASLATGVLLHFDKLIDPKPTADDDTGAPYSPANYADNYLHCEHGREEIAEGLFPQAATQPATSKAATPQAPAQTAADRAAAIAELKKDAQEAEAHFEANGRPLTVSEIDKSGSVSKSPVDRLFPMHPSNGAASGDTSSSASGSAPADASPVQVIEGHEKPAPAADAAPLLASDPCEVRYERERTEAAKMPKAAQAPEMPTLEASASDPAVLVKLRQLSDKATGFKPQANFVQALWVLTTTGGVIGRTIYQMAFGLGLLACLGMLLAGLSTNPGRTLLLSPIWIPLVTLLFAVPFALGCHFMINLGAWAFGWISPVSGVSSTAGVVVFGAHTVISKGIEVTAQQHAEHLVEKL